MRYFHSADGVRTKKQKINYTVTEGLTHASAVKKNSIIDSKNLGTRDMPAAKIRSAFGMLPKGIDFSCGAGFINGVFYYSNGTHFVYDGVERFEISGGRKQFENFNGRVLIFPDRLYYDPVNDKSGTLDTSTGVIKYRIIKRNVNGESWGLSIIAPEDFSVVDLFDIGDGVFIDGNKDLGIYGFHTIIAKYPRYLVFGKFEFGMGDAFDVEGELSRGGPKSCDAACVSGGRVWVATNGKIFASTLNDERNWAVGGDDENTSYMCDMEGSDKITFCCEYDGSPVFFTERGIYKMYGDRASNFTLRCVSGHGGVAQRFSETAKRVGDKIYYLTESGVACFDGNTPVIITSSPVEGNITAATGGGDGERYYLSVIADGEKKFYVYDTVSDIWQCWGNYYFDDIFITQHGTCGTCNKTVYMFQPKTEILPEGYIYERGMVAEIRLGNTDLSDGARPVCMHLFGFLPDIMLSLTAVYDDEEVDVTDKAVVCQDHLIIPLLPRQCDRFSFIVRGGGRLTLEAATLEVVYG